MLSHSAIGCQGCLRATTQVSNSMLCTAPLLMTSLQFAAQNLMARLVMRCGLIRKAADKEALSWRQYAKEGMAAGCMLNALASPSALHAPLCSSSHWGQAAYYNLYVPQLLGILGLQTFARAAFSSSVVRVRAKSQSNHAITPGCWGLLPIASSCLPMPEQSPDKGKQVAPAHCTSTSAWGSGP